ncbi:MAG: 4-demethylwyosine synthase TYW1 [Candidatus Bathyarchaeota archaeon]|nr:4-demethylwyosine synthase TYW1 [Candidatus Bathyarchaeota archaeon]
MHKELPQVILSTLKRQKYQLVGSHSGVKKCKWLHQSLINNRGCYKSKFYGIQSHRCLQMTPAVAFCNMQCMFCWRVQSDEIGVKWNELKSSVWDEPEEIVEGSIDAQKRMLIGYNAQVKDGKIEPKKLYEALNPKHVAISLSGEPTIYPNLDELIFEFNKRDFSSFLVTNGMCPEVLENLTSTPSQIYISLCAPNEDIFKRLCRPRISKAWERLMSSLSLIDSFNCPTAIRITSVEGLNMKEVEEYSKIIRRASPTYIEVKAYMYIGYSRRRLNFQNMANHSEIRRFGKELSEITGYNIIDESVDSRVVLLSEMEKPIQIS